jgi:hypothetical protein
MALLEDLYDRFIKIPKEKQLLHIRAYRTKRVEDLSHTNDYKAGEKKRKSGKDILKELSPKDRALIEMLGLSGHDIKKLQKEK